MSRWQVKDAPMSGPSSFSAVPFRRGFRCPCGQTIMYESTAAVGSPESFVIVGELRHPEPMDAACRLVRDALADELTALQNETLQRAARQMGRP